MLRDLWEKKGMVKREGTEITGEGEGKGGKGKEGTARSDRIWPHNEIPETPLPSCHQCQSTGSLYKNARRVGHRDRTYSCSEKTTFSETLSTRSTFDTFQCLRLRRCRLQLLRTSAQSIGRHSDFHPEGRWRCLADSFLVLGTVTTGPCWPENRLRSSHRNYNRDHTEHWDDTELSICGGASA